MFGRKNPAVDAAKPVFRAIISDTSSAVLVRFKDGRSVRLHYRYVIEYTRIHVMGNCGANKDFIDSTTLISTIMGRVIREAVIAHKTSMAAYKFLTNYTVSNVECTRAIFNGLFAADFDPKIHAFSITEVTASDELASEIAAVAAMRTFKSNMRKLSRFIKDNPDISLSSGSTVGAQNLFDLYNKYILNKSPKT